VNNAKGAVIKFTRTTENFQKKKDKTSCSKSDYGRIYENIDKNPENEIQLQYETSPFKHVFRFIGVQDLGEVRRGSEYEIDNKYIITPKLMLRLQRYRNLGELSILFPGYVTQQCKKIVWV